MKILLVKWVDSNIIHGWRPRGDECDKVASCETVGFLVESDDNKVVLAMSRSSDDNILETIAIPRGCITEIKVLRAR